MAKFANLKRAHGLAVLCIGLFVPTILIVAL